MSEFRFPAVLNTGNGKASITAFNADAPQPVFMADEFHPNYDKIIKGLKDGDPNVWALFDFGGGVLARFKEITERVSWNGTDVLWDGSPVHSTLAQQLTRAIEDGDERNYTAVAKFWEKLESNPNEHSRRQTYDFLSSHQFQITDEGDVVAYKGVYTCPDGEYRSTRSSSVRDVPSAYVNGTPQPPMMYVTQKVGDLVTMPREEVNHDPHKSCSRGLHVSTLSYSQSYGEVVLRVLVNPRDFVSVPHDARGEKVRVCRYVVDSVHGPDGDISDSPVLRETETVHSWTGVGYTGI